MVSLPQSKEKTVGESHGCGTTCGTSCGGGLEKIFPTTAVRFGAMNWIGEFQYRPGTTFKCGAKVVIESDRGVEMGQQVSLSCNGCNKQVTRKQIQEYVSNSGAEFYKLNSGRIIREATEQDILEQQQLNGHLNEDIESAALVAAQLELDLKIVTCEHLLGGERIVFYFMSDTRIDFRDLVKELAHQYHTRIEMRQVGPRDEARLVADYEICGRECCCKNFLKHTHPITMKMAKVQKSTLDPSKVSGRCGRLRCCLRYEHEGYEELDAKLPRVGVVVDSEHGPAIVIDRQILTQLLMVRAQDGKVYGVALEAIKGVLPANAYTPPAPPEERRDARADRGEPPGRRPDGRNQERGAGGRPPPVREPLRPRSPQENLGPPAPPMPPAPPAQRESREPREPREPNERSGGPGGGANQPDRGEGGNDGRRRDSRRRRRRRPNHGGRDQNRPQSGPPGSGPPGSGPQGSGPPNAGPPPQA